MAQYGNTEYWDSRYQRDPNPFDWYQQWEDLRETIYKTSISKDDKILIFGCGTSRLTEEMYNEGHQNMCSIDISPTCIDIMKKKHADTPALIFKQMDGKDMNEFKDGEFDVVIDKGTLDSLMCGNNAITNVQAALSEIKRVLKPTGIYICISYGEPASRLIHLKTEALQWNVDIQTIKKPVLNDTIAHIDEGVHYVYICQKTVADANRQ